ncbi:MAG: phospholipase, partial [Chloroflexota bacterium]|nr:phospholipase [Chloroflexota bacterium]
TSTPFEVFESLLNTVLSASDRIYLADHAYVRTIDIPADGIGATSFQLSKDDVHQLYNNGQKAAKDFFATWDFETYKAVYRRNNNSKK